MKIAFGLKRIGADSEEGEDGADESKDEKKKPFGEAGTEMAVRALAKSFGIDPDEVDTAKAARALRAIVTACGDSNDSKSDEDY